MQDLSVNKPLLLLAYLCVQGGWVGRDEVAHTFWPDATQRQARANLRQLLWRARGLPLASELEATPKALRWTAASDVEAFTTACAAGDWAAAVALNRGDLLEGIEGIDTGHAMTWLEVEREALRRRWRDACERRVGDLLRAGDHASAGDLLHRLLERDALSEDVLQDYLRSAIGAGRRQRAVRLYRAFEARLGAELGLEPLDATRQLVDGLRDDDDRIEAVPRHTAATAPPAAPRLQTHRTPLIGRARELAELAHLLDQSEPRLVTLVGPGGIGKTRLASEVAAARETRHEYGCIEVACAALDDADLVPIAIAEQLGLTLAGRDDPVEQLRAYLRDKAMLVVLDNLEHLLDGCAFLTELVEGCPELRVLSTSREPLGIAPETVFEVSGLGHPRHDLIDEGPVDGFDAVRLFVVRAHERAPRFRMEPDDERAVVELCRYVHGNPLALELAAAWVRLLRPAEILDAVRQDLDTLTPAATPTTASPDRPTRHDGLRAVFDHSWDLLDDREREALLALSVTRGGASKEAALAVTGAPLRTLLALVNKSLLERSDGGRFAMLEPLRQYVEARARADHGAHAGARDRHLAWFDQVLAERGPALKGGPEQREAFAVLERDWANVRAAWRRACERCDTASLATMSSGLATFLERRGRFREGLAACLEARAALTEPGALQRRLDVWTAAFQTNLGALAAARDTLRGVLAHADDDEPATRAHALLRLGMVERTSGAYDAAREHTAAALTLAQQLDDRSLAAEATNNLGVLAALRGDLAGARAHFVASAKHREATGDRWAASIALLNLGNVERDLGRLDRAERHYQASLEAAREHDNPRGVAFALGTLASIDVFRGAYASAERRYREALELRRTLGDRWGEANTLQHLASVVAERAAGAAEAGSADQGLREADHLLHAAADVTEAIGDDQGRANLAATQASVLALAGRHAEASARFQEAMRRAEDVGHAHGVQTAREGLARAALAMGDGERAEALFLEVLRFAADAGFVQLQLAAVAGLAECRAARGDTAMAASACAAVTHHHGAAHALRVRAAAVHERLQTDARARDPSAAAPTDSAEDALAHVVAELLAGLKRPTSSLPDADPDPCPV